MTAHAVIPMNDISTLTSDWSSRAIASLLACAMEAPTEAAEANTVPTHVLHTSNAANVHNQVLRWNHRSRFTIWFIVSTVVSAVLM